MKEENILGSGRKIKWMVRVSYIIPITRLPTMANGRKTSWKAGALFIMNKLLT
jgi:hypothetical protein